MPGGTGRGMAQTGIREWLLGANRPTGQIATSRSRNSETQKGNRETGRQQQTTPLVGGIGIVLLLLPNFILRGTADAPEGQAAFSLFCALCMFRGVDQYQVTRCFRAPEGRVQSPNINDDWGSIFGDMWDDGMRYANFAR